MQTNVYSTGARRMGWFTNGVFNAGGIILSGHLPHSGEARGLRESLRAA